MGDKPARMAKIAREIKGFSGEAEPLEPASEEPECAALRKAFVGDGSETAGELWRRNFSHYRPILDWVHATCYVYAAAMAGVSAAVGWTTYCRWAQ